MRIFLMAAVAACVAGAAWADVPSDGTNDSVYSARIAEEITRTVDAALRQALADLESARLDSKTLAEVRAAMDSARAEVRAELAGLDGRLSSLDETQEAVLEARLEAAVETALERASAALEAASEVEPEEGQ